MEDTNRILADAIFASLPCEVAGHGTQMNHCFGDVHLTDFVGEWYIVNKCDFCNLETIILCCDPIAYDFRRLLALDPVGVWCVGCDQEAKLSTLLKKLVPRAEVLA